MKFNLSTRQRVRKALLLVNFLLFPITMNYLSPYVIIDGASRGVLNGSAVVFGLLFLSALLVGRLWCGWLCPVSGILDMTFSIQNKPANIRRLDWVKWVIWVVWIGVIIWMLVMARGYHRVELGLDTQEGISLAGSPDRPIFIAYIIYYAVLAIMIIPGLILGRRAACHAICWMAPFMILGRKILNLAAWPVLRLEAKASDCTKCKICTNNCPMSLDVNQMVQQEQMEHDECILCGTCVDGCPQHAIHFRFSSGK